MYRCEARNISDFIRQLAVNYIGRGYYFCVKGEIPQHKDPRKTDEKIIEQYGIAISKWTRARQRKLGVAGIQYLRLGRQFVIAATHGAHKFFEDEAAGIQDVRRSPLQISIFSIGYKEGEERGHVSVRIQRDVFNSLKRELEARALSASLEELQEELARVHVDPYSAIRSQIWSLVRAVNRRRKLAGQELVSNPRFSWRARPKSDDSLLIHS